MNQIVLNKSKNKTILFIHGFYANAGYWLPYISFFKNYKIILLDIDYQHLLTSDEMIPVLKDLVEQVNQQNEFDAIISHSLGTIVSGFAKNYTTHKGFDICPVGFSTRLNTLEFIEDLHLRVNKPKQQIRNNLLLVDELINKSKTHLKSDNLQYIPKSDKYFFYHERESKYYIKFKGDHFDITEAIIDIAKKLK